MNHDPDEQGELKALFEQSAPSLNPIARGRLRARAREIPERKTGLLLLPSLWAWATVLGALGAAGVVFLSLNNKPPEKPLAASPALASAGEAPLASALAPAPEAEGGSADEVDELASSAEFDDPMSPDLLDDLALDPGDLAETEVDAWISAAGATLGG